MAVPYRDEGHIKKVILRPGGPCPCGSGKTIQACHLDIDGRFRKPPPGLTPPGPLTGFSHAACYLRGTCNCSPQISREHYISKSVLQQLGEVLHISGMPWLGPDETLDITVNNLTAKILCKRHNEALSPLDTEAGHFFSVLTAALIDLDRKTLSRRPIFHLIGGDTLELWMLKVACGLFYSVGSSKDGVLAAKKYSIDLMKVQRAFFEGEWDAGAGLHFRGSIGSIILPSHGVDMTTLTMDHKMSYNGVEVGLNGFGLVLIFDTTDSDPPWSGLVTRPSDLILSRRQREHHIILTWPPGTPDSSVVIAEAPLRRHSPPA